VKRKLLANLAGPVLSELVFSQLTIRAMELSRKRQFEAFHLRIGDLVPRHRSRSGTTLTNAILSHTGAADPTF
jgi:hypothetical protein